MVKRAFLLVVALLMSLCAAALAWAADGDLDIAFDTDGKITTPIMNGNDTAAALAIQPDGKIVVVGSSYNGIDYDFALARYNLDGSLDTTFDADGKVTTAILGADEAWGVAIQPDDKIVVAGDANNLVDYPFTLARYNLDGSLDSTFGSGGKITTPILNIDNAKAVAIQRDGNIVAAGFSYNGTDTDFRNPPMKLRHIAQ